MKGIILAAGAGTRLSPATLPISKILLPVYDRPMIYYPLSTLMMAGIKDILVITNENDHDNFVRTLGDGSQFGLRIRYDIQHVQRGIADVFFIAKDFIAGEKVCLVLGDNIFYSADMEDVLVRASGLERGAVVFGQRVPDPERFGVVEFDSEMNVISLEEKPSCPRSDYAAVGLYFYDGKACDLVKSLKPSFRGELEITDLNKEYLRINELRVEPFPEGTKWIDAGTFSSLLEASVFVKEEEGRTGSKILCPEIIAYERGLVTKKELLEWVSGNKDNEYFGTVKRIISEI